MKMLKFFVFAILCVCTFADLIIPHTDCAVHYSISGNKPGDIFYYEVHQLWDGGNTFYALDFGWEIDGGVNTTYEAVLRSDINSDPEWGTQVIRFGSSCEETKAKPANMEFEYTNGPTEAECPDGSSGCHKYENTITGFYIILDQKNRTVRTESGETLKYFDDYPTNLSMFAVTTCDGTEIPAPTANICFNTSSSSSVHSSSSSAHSSSVHSSSAHSSSAHSSSSVHSSSTHSSSTHSSSPAVSSSVIMVAVTAALIAVVTLF